MGFCYSQKPPKNISTYLLKPPKHTPKDPPKPSKNTPQMHHKSKNCHKAFPFFGPEAVRSNFNTREINSRENYRFFGHNSAPCGNFWTILRHKLPIIHRDLPIPSNDLNSSVQPEFLNPELFM